MKRPIAPAGKLRKPLAIAVGALVAQLAAPLFAQDAPVAREGLAGPSAPVLEEIIVTSQKRAESLQDVPISVIALSGDKLAEAGIENLEDLTAYMPNIHFTETGFSTQVRVRGIGSGNSQGFEQSVGMYIDGIYYGRAQLFRTPFMDMERAELLRGPQTILFGKNSISGALNLTTAKPTDFLTGALTVSQEFETDQTEVNAHISGPITSTLNGRLAVRKYEEDGYLTNTYQDREEPQTEEQSIRLSLDWTPIDNLSFYLKAQRDEFDVVGRAIEITQDIPLNQGGPTYAQVLQILQRPTIDGELDYRRQTDADEFSNNEVNNVTFSVEYGFNDHTLTVLSGWLDFSYDELCDCDYTPAEILHLELYEDYDQFSQEIRLASPVGQKFEWIAGAYYQEYDQKYLDDLALSETNVLPNLQAALAPLSGTGFLREFEQSSEAWALFAQGTWNVTDQLHVTVGARYTEEDKSAHKSLNIYDDLDTRQISSNPLLGYLYLLTFQAENNQATLSFADPNNPTPFRFTGADISGDRSESAFMPLLNVEYDFNDDIMGYASITRGFKAGGFDPRANQIGNFPTTDTSATEDDPNRFFEFNEEEATSMELGMKSTLAGGRAELNVALYRTEYEDLQVSQFDGGVGFNVGNAEETLVQGIELDGRWLLFDGLTLGYGASYLDFEYEDFTGGNCYVGQGGGVDINDDGDSDICDYTGKRDVFTPEYTLNLSLDYITPINSYLDFAGFLDVQHVDSHQVHVNLDPTGEIDAYTIVNLRLGVEAKNWAVAILGKNLLDEEVVTVSSNAPLSDSNFLTNTHYSFVRRPMTVALEGTVRF